MHSWPGDGMVLGGICMGVHSNLLLTADLVGEQSEGAIRRNEGQHSFRLCVVGSES